uniref:Uncharacterized protein n=1 Tax=Triticum urartu TaxID=4572 RepID=A0A8R7UBN9_TRIUA
RSRHEPTAQRLIRTEHPDPSQHPIKCASHPRSIHPQHPEQRASRFHTPEQQFQAELSFFGVANGGHRDAGGGGAREEDEARGAPHGRRRRRGGVRGEGELRGGDQGVGLLGRVCRRRRVRGQGARRGARQVRPGGGRAQEPGRPGSLRRLLLCLMSVN